MIKNLGLISFTKEGSELAEKIPKGLKLDAVIHEKEDGPGRAFVKEYFGKCDALVFVGAMGICVRLIAPYIERKDKDPAVICIDEKGDFVIPVLSGHIGGANRLAKEIADVLGATPILTTGTDVNGKFAVDTWAVEQGMVIENTGTIKAISGGILDGEKIGLCVEGFEISGNLPEELKEDTDLSKGIRISIHKSKSKEPIFKEELRLVPKILSLGIGCRKGTDALDIEEFFCEIMEEQELSPLAIRNVCSIDIKKDEPGIVEFCRKMEFPFVTYSAEELEAAPGIFTASEFVKETVGVDNVCERSALLGAEQGTIIMRKKSKAGITMALAIKEFTVRF